MWNVRIKAFLYTNTVASVVIETFRLTVNNGVNFSHAIWWQIISFSVRMRMILHFFKYDKNKHCPFILYIIIGGITNNLKLGLE